MPTLIYHITASQNVPRIVAARELRCKNLCGEHSSIAHANIQARRSVQSVPCGPGGVLHDYVPFYFAPRSPMLYVLNRGGVEGYAEGQDSIVYFVSSVERVIAARIPFVFTDGHGAVALSRFCTDWHADSQRIDWDIIAARYWRDTQDDPDRSRRRQAEFLVHRAVPWALIEGVGVRRMRMKASIEALLPEPARALLAVRPDWYY